MRHLLAAVAVLALTAFSPAGDDKAGFETVLKKLDGGPEKAAEVVIRSEKEWTAFVATVSSEAFRAELSKAKIDFGKEIAVAVARGPSQCVLTEGEGIQKVTLDGDHAIVQYTVTEADQRDTKYNHAFQVVRTAKAKEVTFKKTAKVVGG
jgi:hypothetical protein